MFEVTVHDPYSEHPHLTDERFECEDRAALVDRLESVTGWHRTDCADVAAAVAAGHTYEGEVEGGSEVTAKRVEQVGAVG